MGFIKYAFEMGSCSMTYVPSFMMIGIGIQAILEFYFGILKACNVGITGVRYL
jgi:hypothetical protein